MHGSRTAKKFSEAGVFYTSGDEVISHRPENGIHGNQIHADVESRRFVGQYACHCGESNGKCFRYGKGKISRIPEGGHGPARSFLFRRNSEQIKYHPSDQKPHCYNGDSGNQEQER